MYSSFYYYDISFVSIYGISLFYYSLFNYNRYLLFIQIFFIIKFYLLSSYYLITRDYNKQLICHLSFRYTFFLWSYTYINNFTHNRYLLFISINYHLYNYYLYKSIKKYNLYIYLKHSLQILSYNILMNYIYYSIQMT